MNMIGIFAKNREEWLLQEYADFLYNLTLVPLYDTLGEDGIKYILEQTGIESTICTEQSLTQLIKSKSIGNLKNVIIMERTLSEKALKEAQDKNLTVFFFWDLIEKQTEVLPVQ
jgi:long-chain acyl-CoA synthetase